MTESTNIDKIASGVPGLDELLAGGLPRGRATLIKGRSGTGKTIMTLQVANAMARGGERTVFVSVEERPEDLLSLGQQLGFGTRELAADRRLTIVDMVPDFGLDLAIAGDFDLSGLALQILKAADEADARIIALDSISALLAPLRSGAPRRHLLANLVSQILATGRTLILTSGAGDPDDYGSAGSEIEDYVCDAVVVMRNVVDGKRRRRSVEVHKYRRSGHLKGEYPCAVTREGLSVFPLDASDDTQDADAELVTERFKSGVSGLDAMTRGGWLRDAITLVRGPTGSGKTILSGMYACAGAARGERVFYYGFEETAAVLLRNYDLLEIPFRAYVDSGDIKLVARFPEATSPEDMIIELRTVLEEHSPSLIVLDSISAIEHVTSYESFRQFVVGITSALRQHGRSALLTQSVADEQSVDLHAPYLSTLADAILLLGYDLGDEDMHRYIRVLKMRGSAHSLRPHRLSIGPGGLHVPEPARDEPAAD